MTFYDSAWRTENIGRLLFAATDRFVGEKIATVHRAGFVTVSEALLALFQNLDRNGTRLTTIALRASLSKQSMMELVDKAERLGLVERQPDTSDKRAKIVLFTPPGLRLLGHLRKGVIDTERRMAHDLGEDFMAEMKDRLAAYATNSAPLSVPVADIAMSARNAAWRMHNIGRILGAATTVFTGDILDVAHGNGAEMVTPVQLALYRNLDLDGTRLTEIATRARMTKPAMLELVERAVSLGFVERRADPSDGRAKIIHFSATGLHMLEQLHKGVTEAEQRMALSVGPEFLAEMKARLRSYAIGDGVARMIGRNEMADQRRGRA